MISLSSAKSRGGLQALAAKRVVVVLDRLGRGQRAVADRPHQPHDVERRLGEVDLAPEESDLRAVFLRLVDELEAVARGARPAAEHADHEARVVADELVERLRPVVGDLEEPRPLDLGQAREAAHDRVVDEVRDRFLLEAAVDVRVEHLEEVGEAVRRRFLAERPERLERGDIRVEVVGEGDRIETEVGQRLGAGDRGGAERAGRLIVVGRAPMAPDVGRVVGADGGLDLRAGEGVALDELFQVADRGQHDVDDVLGDDRLDRLQEFLASPQARPRAVGQARRTHGVEARPHVGILGVGDDEVGALVRAGANVRELVVETSHSTLRLAARRRL